MLGQATGCLWPPHPCLDVGSHSPVPAPVVLSYSCRWDPLQKEGQGEPVALLVASTAQPSSPGYGWSWRPRQAPCPLGRLEVWSSTQEHKSSTQTGHVLSASPVSGLLANLKQPRGARSSYLLLGVVSFSTLAVLWHMCPMLLPVPYF